MAWQIIAINKITGKIVELGGNFETVEEAQWQVKNNIEFAENESPNEWAFEIYDDKENFGKPINLEDFDPYDEEPCDLEDSDSYYDEPYDLECGFNSYLGSYDYDC